MQQQKDHESYFGRILRRLQVMTSRYKILAFAFGFSLFFAAHSITKK